jgi:hypothetical protein
MNGIVVGIPILRRDWRGAADASSAKRLKQEAFFACTNIFSAHVLGVGERAAETRNKL